MHEIECFCVCSPVDGVVEEDEFAFVHPLVLLQQRRRKARVSIFLFWKRPLCAGSNPFSSRTREWTSGVWGRIGPRTFRVRVSWTPSAPLEGWCQRQAPLGSSEFLRRVFFRANGVLACKIEVCAEKRRRKKCVLSHLLLFTFEGDFDAFDGDFDVDFPLLHRLGFEFVLSTAEQNSSDLRIKWRMVKIHISVARPCARGLFRENCFPGFTPTNFEEITLKFFGAEQRTDQVAKKLSPSKNKK